MSPEPRVLFLDAYDSFSHNIVSLLEVECKVQVTSVYIDTVIPDFEEFLSQFSAVVCGPGPGNPACLTDVGLFKKLWMLPQESLLPVLGICLGFQSLAHEFGASVVPLRRPRHGIKTPVTSRLDSIFENLPVVDTVQYHSLHARLRGKDYHSIADNDLWVPSQECPQLQPLAWDLSSQQGEICSFYENPLAILMGVKHVSKPFYGIQFHPESICSDRSAKQIVANWWKLAQAWPRRAKPKTTLTDPTPLFDWEAEAGSHNTSPRTTPSRVSEQSSVTTSASLQERVHPKVISASLPIGSLTVPSISEALNLQAEELIILDSEMRQLPQLGESSIIGIVTPKTRKIVYSVGRHEVSVQAGAVTERIDLDQFDGNIFSYLRDFMSGFSIERDDEKAFCGGLMGYISYEACLETLDINVSPSAGHPDLSFAFVERSILLDHKRQSLHIQGLVYDDDSDSDTSQWISKTASVLESLSNKSASQYVPEIGSLASNVMKRSLPQESDYKGKIARCQQEINAGESYELCLTDQTSITLKDRTSEWSMYKDLRSVNPANFGAYVRLGPLTLLSTSPERFMQWSRFEKSSSTHTGNSATDEQVATCQFRPMKGTVRKRQERPDGSVHNLTREEAIAILAVPKEQAENLMILDLIRHDLHTVCKDVTVPGLMVVEDYASVYQMISVIEGKITKPSYFGPGEGKSGIDCLAASLPPGSMTGAPKKRSCEILQGIEKKPRSIYSGVLGYIDISGKGDFNVLIRSMYKWDNEGDANGGTWNIGAGGAVTTLSTEDGEWEEMLTKMQSTYRLFGTASS